MNAQQAQALALLLANDVATAGAVIDSVSVPSGAGSKEFARIPSAWLMLSNSENRDSQDQPNADTMAGTPNS
jgi:hypothetical protein